MNKLSFIICLVFLFSTTIVFSQSYEYFFSDDYKNTDSSKFSISVDNVNFIKNNEYFNDFLKGYTLIGYFIKPTVIYRPYKILNIHAGVFLRKYFGAKDFIYAKPVFSIRYFPNKNLSLLFGELHGTLNHELTDFVLFNENFFTNNSENGIQLIFDNGRIRSDTWLDWKQYIYENSDYPEILLFGTSNRFNILNSNDKNILNIRLSAVASHVGGQINISDEPVETIINTITGFEYEYKFDINEYISNIKFFSLHHFAFDSSPNKRLAYSNGYGILTGIELSNRIFDFKFHHWFGNKYFSKFGNPMFQSISTIDSNFNKETRAFFKTHLFWVYDPLKYFKLGAGTDFYFNIHNKKTDYSFGFYILFKI